MVCLKRSKRSSEDVHAVEDPLASDVHPGIRRGCDWYMIPMGPSRSISEGKTYRPRSVHVGIHFPI